MITLNGVNLFFFIANFLGIIDAAVMGGITNYEKVFFSDEYIDNYPDDSVLIQRLKDLIADQIPLLELCVKLHRDRVTADLMPLHNRIEGCFVTMQENVFAKYGKRVKRTQNVSLIALFFKLSFFSDL